MLMNLYFDLLTWTVSYVIIQFCLQVRWQTPDQDVNMEKI